MNWFIFNIELEVLARTVRQENEIIKGIQKEEKVKLSLFIHNMILCMRPKNSTTQFLEITNNLSKTKR